MAEVRTDVLQSEQERLQCLGSLCILDSPPEPAFDALTSIAAKLFCVPTVLISLVDKHRQFFMSVVGFPSRETARDVSFCRHALSSDTPLIVLDTCLDERFANNSLVTGEPFIRFYAGAPLLSETGIRLGTFCIIDQIPHATFGEEESSELIKFAGLASKLIQQRTLPSQLEGAERESARLERRVAEILRNTSDSVFLLDLEWRITYLNAGARSFVHSEVEPIGTSFCTLFPETTENADAWAALRRCRDEQIEVRFEYHSVDQVFEVQVSPTSDGPAMFFREVTRERALQNSIRLSEHRLRGLVRATSTLIWITSALGTSKKGSEEWQEFTGQAIEPMLEFGWINAIHPEDQLKTQKAWREAAEAKRPYEIEHRVRRKDGVYRLMRGYGVPLLNEAGELVEWVGSHTDLTARETMEQELREANERFVLATKVTTDGIWDLDCTSNKLWYSARWKDTLGLKERDLPLHSIEQWFERIHSQDLPAVLQLWQDIQQNSDPSFEFEARFRHEDGSWPWILGRGLCHRGPTGALLRLTGAMSNITARKAVDPLTGLHNRASLLRHVQWRIDTSGKEARNFGLLFLDLDCFKRVNDSLGHQQGDCLLVEAARRLAETVEATTGSIAARLGGDEFVVLLSDIATEQDVLTYSAAIEYLLASPIDCSGKQIFVSASIGAVLAVPGHYTSASQVLEDADIAMYRAKANGKARTAIYSPAMRNEAIARLDLETDLRRALEMGEFEVHYQPKIKLATGEVMGFEALIRWRHPERGMIAPAEFIPLSEQTGLIGQLGRWVASQAIRQLAYWRRKGVVASDVTMAVNVSIKQFGDEDLLAFFKDELRVANLPEACLVLEITESVLMQDTPRVLTLLNEITGAGIGLDLDDFGTGYSSLSYLHRFPFRSVKIDQSFIKRMSSDPQSISLVASIIGLAASLDMGVVAEGVETAEQLKYLEDMACEVAQGYLFAAAQPAVLMEECLQRWNQSQVTRAA